ncbi:protein jag [Deinococcus peraridilitoris]|uniref:Putative RNA-binding protein n=1 Tax=Deinococcus peraridilitoris (strain DSM 19664 / LMG 22246 / CIP 109416 / KR-200) TaxID=937777 RepID=L0A2D1_DEIPD|nr:protein jag [Deinococcus peraridilitoris]AFZ68058.1 putative RNA-binding protein [Deinococcus peraridilitoris DSM 19664]
MDKKTNLDDYLADLGISEAEDEAPPRPPVALPESPRANVPSEAPSTIVERFLRGLLSRIDETLEVTVREAEDAVEADITGERAGRLAGRDGRVLAAIELLTHTVLSKHTGRADARVRIDAGGFRRRHADNLTKLAERLAVQVAKSGESHELQPMPPGDRRIMHIALKEHPDVMTESVGEGPGRHLIIRPRHASN